VSIANERRALTNRDIGIHQLQPRLRYERSHPVSENASAYDQNTR
jgi:hypothetical protein